MNNENYRKDWTKSKEMLLTQEMTPMIVEMMAVTTTMGETMEETEIASHSNPTYLPIHIQNYPIKSEPLLQTSSTQQEKSPSENGSSS
jgi:alanine dehydrogenase